MISFHGNKAIKAKYINRIKGHIKADNLIRGQGWIDGKGCAVGCTLEAYDHSRYPIELGIPEWLARLEDSLFEGMSIEKSKTWPLLFLQSIKPGIDLEKVKTPFIIVVLKQNLKSMNACKFDKNKFPDVVKALDDSKLATKQMIKAYTNGKDLSAARSASSAARSAAESAAWSAAWSASSAASSASSAAESAAWSAAWSASSAASSASSAARSAAWSAWSAARSAARSAAESAARSAARSAAESAARSAAWSAWSAARSAAEQKVYNYFADELLKIIKAIK